MQTFRLVRPLSNQRPPHRRYRQIISLEPTWTIHSSPRISAFCLTKPSTQGVDFPQELITLPRPDCRNLSQ